MVSEHGLLGFVAMALLIARFVTVLTKRAPLRQKAFASAFMAWTILFLMINAMRLVAPAYVFGLANADLFPEEET